MLKECPFCHGSGKSPGTNLSCAMCKGHGVIEYRWNSGPYLRPIVEEKLEDKIIERVGERVLVRCGLCGGSGELPWKVLTPSWCRVCSGKGSFWKEEPIKLCYGCSGTGIQPNVIFRVPCEVCGGEGVIKVPEGKECPLCRGTGFAPGTLRTCAMCKGEGVIAEELAPPIRTR